ncbi:MAG: aldo/keto reductase [Gemmatimonadetes bacterium]|nr:aldo/keto reductase [Gemmatimonadota bacterium]
MESAMLGNTGIEVSRLCFGTGTNGWNGRSNQTDLGLKGLSDLLNYGYSQGINFWDSADQYGSHPHVADALKRVERGSVVVASKTCAKTPREAESDITRFLEELDTDYVDVVLMHCLTSRNWPDTFSGVMEVLEKKKEAGVIRSHGVSCHDFGAFEVAARTSWVDVVLARINYAGKHMDGPPEKIIPVLEEMDEAGIGVYGMKVVGCGELGGVARDAIHFALDLGAIDSITVGMKNKTEVDENIGHVESHDRALSPA